MTRYGASLDVGAELEREKKLEEQLKVQGAAGMPKPQVQRRVPVGMSGSGASDNSDAEVSARVEWWYIIGAVLFIAVLIVLFSWSRASASDVMVPSSDLEGELPEDATAQDVAAQISRISGSEQESAGSVDTASPTDTADTGRASDTSVS